jgi:serine phosphatase RsbU (regulator of sigma subunit)
MASLVPLASLFVARLDPSTGKLEYCSAGHPPALLLRANGELEMLSEGGLLLGVVAAAPYVRGCVELGPGDVLLAYSDGVLESLNKSEEEFGSARLEHQLRRSTMGARASRVRASITHDDKSLTLASSNPGSDTAVAQVDSPEGFRGETISAEAILFSVLGAVQDFAATHPIVDDMSLVIIRRDSL